MYWFVYVVWCIFAFFLLAAIVCIARAAPARIAGCSLNCSPHTHTLTESCTHCHWTDGRYARRIFWQNWWIIEDCMKNFIWEHSYCEYKWCSNLYSCTFLLHSSTRTNIPLESDLVCLTPPRPKLRYGEFPRIICLVQIEDCNTNGWVGVVICVVCGTSHAKVYEMVDLSCAKLLKWLIELEGSELFFGE